MAAKRAAGARTVSERLTGRHVGDQVERRPSGRRSCKVIEYTAERLNRREAKHRSNDKLTGQAPAVVRTIVGA